MTFQRLPDGGVLFTGTGVVAGEQTVALNRELYASEEAVRSIRYQIIDLSRVTEFSLSSADIQTLARQDSLAMGVNPSMVVAIVCTDELTYGMNRMYAAYLEGGGESVQLFPDLDQAKAWIRETVPGVDP